MGNTIILHIKQTFILLALFYSPLVASVLTDNTTTAINDRECFDITYNETDTGSVDNITLSINLTHTWRSDLEITLTSPSGTTIDIIDRKGNDSDNLFVLFDDNAAIEIEDDFSNHTTTVTREPDDNFSRFDGENALGTWRLRICDRAGGDTGQYTTSTLSITTIANFFGSNIRPFEKVLINGNINTNIAGDLLVIGNQSLCMQDSLGRCAAPSAIANNNDIVQRHANLDPVARASGFINSTSSNLILEPDDVVIEAWLYWMGRLSNTPTLAQRQVTNVIQLRTPTTNGSYVQLTSAPNKFNWIDGGFYFDYTGAVNVTEFVQEGGTYWVADLQATSNIRNQGSGWALAVIVEDRGFPKKRSVKNISLYDGFTAVYSLDPIYPPTVSANITGFLTPKTGNINSNLILFASETDRALSDTMSVTNNSGTVIPLVDSRNDANNVQNATISQNGQNVTTRNPSFENTLGVDIDEIYLGTRDDNSSIIEHNQTSTTITLTSLNDRLFFSMFGFATDLYVPEVCYDYTVSRNGFDITLDNRKIETYDGNLSITLALKSLDGDFDFTNSQISVRLTPSENTSFKNAFYSPDGINTLIDAIYTEGSTDLTPTIGLGEDLIVDANGFTTGGTIKTNQRYFSQFNYTVNTPTGVKYIGKFEVDLNTTINFGSGDVPVYQSTEFNQIPRCPQSLTYRPQIGNFNVERRGSTGEPLSKYPLWTQVVGKPFDFDVVFYDETFTNEVPLGGPREDEIYTIDIELINADPFNDKDNIFTCTNTDSSIVKPLTNTGRKHAFVRFEGTSRVEMNNIQTDTALRNAAFRLWYIRDANGTLIRHNCPDPQDDLTASNSCFEDLYAQHLEQDDNTTFADGTKGFCGATSKYGSCSNYKNRVNGTVGCYACLHDNFSDIVCSRDNFAIRPASYRVIISDNNESTVTSSTGRQITLNNTTEPALLAAGYQYRLSGQATSYISSNTPAVGYNTLFSNLTNNAISSTLNFDEDNNPTTCFDKNSTEWNINFDGGILQPTLVTRNNVGRFLYRIVDTNWTMVDQASNPNKTFPGVNDCIDSSNTISTSNTAMNGCITDTTIVSNGNTYTNLALQFHPYMFDLSTVSLLVLDNNNSNYMFMNDFENEGYTDPIPVPLTMATTFIGDVSARTKGGAITTNFNDDCAAVDLNLTLDKNVSRRGPLGRVDLNSALQNGTLMEDSVTSPSGTATPNALIFQQYLGESNDSSFINNINQINKVTAPNATTTIRSSAFSSSTPNGVASIRLYTNFKKPLEMGVTRLVNPIDINYTGLRVTAPDATSNANGIASYTPEGNNTYNRQITALFSRVVFARPLNENIIEDFIISTAMVDIYCNENVAADITCANYGLATPTREISQEQGWFSAAENNSTATTSYYNATTDGDATFTAIVTHGSAAPMVYGENSFPTTTQAFDGPDPSLPGTMTDINLSIPANTGKPLTIDLSLTPAPHHRFFPNDAKGITKQRNIFRGPSAWSGVGNTGLTGQATSSNNNPRMNW